MSGREEVAWHHCFWHPDLRCVYAWIPKVASTSVKRWLISSTDRWGTLQKSAHVQLQMATLAALPRAEAEEILFSPDVFKFALVRNPYTRLVSAYVSIMVGGKKSIEQMVRHHATRTLAGAMGWAWSRIIAGAEATWKRGLTFREMVDQLGHENHSKLDPHFRGQVKLLQGIPVDFIGKLENLEADFRHVQTRLGRSEPLEIAYRQEYEPTAEVDYVHDWPVARFREMKVFPHWQRFYPPDMARGVAQLYAEDFALLGYPIHEISLRKAA